MADPKHKGRDMVSRGFGSNDVGEWGDKDTRGAYSTPLNIGGELVDVDKLPAFGSDGPDPDANKDARAPIAPAGSP